MNSQGFEIWENLHIEEELTCDFHQITGASLLCNA